MKGLGLGPLEKTFEVELPDGVVEGSTSLVFNVGGSIQAPQLEHLNGLVRSPYGCGEQNMMNFVPNILVLRYLEARNLTDAEVSVPARTYLETGYQRELTYKRNDGSFSAWGQSDPAGSTWLTAYVIRSFHQAAKFAFIDPNVLTRGLEFLMSRQRPNGEFPELGRVIHNNHGSPLALTSFVLLAFYENEETMSRYQSVISRAVQFVARKVDESNDPYDLALAALALTLAKHQKAEQVLTMLESMAKRNGDQKWWTRSDNSVSNDVEMTGYVLLALLESATSESTDKIVNWLISKRNSNGGFSSSQDTVVGLMALTKYEIQTHSPIGAIDINYTFGNNRRTIQVTPQQETKVQSHPLPSDTRDVSFSSSGRGQVQVQLSYRFNVAAKEKSPSFKLTTMAKKSDNQRLVLDICGEYTPVEASDMGKPTNMALMQIQLPSGYVSDPESFANIQAIAQVKRVESKSQDTEVHIYFEQLRPNDRKCLSVKAILTQQVANLRPSWVRLYDYYVMERSATEFYNVDTSLCDVCEGEDCGSGC
ncbi:hypothetical protein M5D96_003985 [Drosophila gunungcola]|uniref:Alpha-macroglobulin receptor-binding domain-containing protein n=2 Tax=Drosophila gunungcola TaxID=103775 RepID=A0A9P9YTV4_9MUSC|nr:hypothetical protein M5D96_003985 [Drosophila gunungcola]